LHRGRGGGFDRGGGGGDGGRGGGGGRWFGLGKKNNEEPGPRGSAGDFLLSEEMKEDPPGREVVEGGGINVLL